MPPPPVSVAPPGSDKNKGPSIEISIWIFTSLALITLIFRIFGRVSLTRNLGWDDFWIVVATILNVLYAAMIEVAIKAGEGRHAYYLGEQQISNAIHWDLIAFIPGVLSFAVPKISVTILLTRLLNPRKIQVYIMYFLSSLTLLGSIIVAILLWQQCQPSEATWNKSIEAKCWPPRVITDFTIAHGGMIDPYTM